MYDFDIWVDFNNVSHAGYTWTLLSTANSEVHKNQHVKAGDHKGNWCFAVVRKLTEDMALLELDLDTFTPAP